ncbi:hypothetical protein MMC19_007219 [Ptychographa xylographoides]|nr:hypothetical protein [Ptychographa xylographoides]
MKFLAPVLLSLLPCIAYAVPNALADFSELQFSVYHTVQIPVHYPPYTNLTWSPISITLIHSAHEAVLIDAPVSTDQTNSLIAWIKATVPTKRLTTLYITHGHGDHFFGIPLLRAAFPGLKVLATTPTIEHIVETLEPAEFANWNYLFPGQIPDQDSDTSFLTALPVSGVFELEGHKMQAIEVGETDTWNTTVLHVPELDMVVTGDAVYGQYYQYLGDSNTPALQDRWLVGIDKVAALKPQIVVPGHMKPTEGFGVEHLEHTRAYILAWQREVKKQSTQEGLIFAMQQLYPDRMGEFILRFSASFAYPKLETV